MAQIRENIVIDNDTQAIYVNGKKWESSPESYMQLRDRMTRRAQIVREIAQVDPRIKMYRTVQAM